MARLRIGSRGSQLALWQASHIKALLEQRGHKVEIEIIKTTGDKITDVALAQVGTKGMFTKEIEEALAEKRVDLAVHSLKDLPTEIPAGFEIAAITTREDARDVFCSRQYNSIEELPNRARVGTSSLRRQAQLKALRPDLDIHPSARKCGHPPAETRGRRVRCHDPGRGRAESAGQAGIRTAGASGEADVSGGGPGRAGSRNSQGRLRRAAARGLPG